jgi:hypothetical protein
LTVRETKPVADGAGVEVGAAGVEVGAADGVGVEVGVALTCACCAVGALLADGLGLVVAGDVQPLIETRTRAPIKSNGRARFNGMLMYRFIILAIGFIFPPKDRLNQ